MNILFMTRGCVHYKILESCSEVANRLFIITSKKHKKDFNMHFKHIKNKNVKVYFTSSLFNYYKKSKFILKKIKIDLIISNCPISGFFTYLIKKNKKSVFIMCQDFLEYFDESKKNKIIKPFIRTLLKNALKFSFKNSYTITLSNYVKNRAKKYGAKKVKVIPIYGVDCKLFYPKKVNKKEFKNYKIILTASRLASEKGLDNIIKAMKIIKNKLNNIKLVIAWGGPLMHHLKNLTKKLKLQNYVIFLGTIDYKKMPYYYNLCNICVVPSLKEGLGFSAGEASACKKPVIASNTGGLPEIVLDKKTGILVESKDIRGLSNEIIKVLKDKKLSRKLGNNGYNHIKKNYNSEKVMKTFKHFIKNEIF